MCNTFFLWHSKGPQTKIKSYSWNGVYFDSNSNCIRLRHVRFWSFSVFNTASVVKTWFSRIICKKIDSELHAVLKNIYSTHDRVLFKRETHTWAGENRLHKTCRHRSNLTAWSVHLSIPSPHMFCLSIRFRLLLRRNEGISVFSFELPGRRKLFDDVMGGGTFKSALLEPSRGSSAGRVPSDVMYTRPRLSSYKWSRCDTRGGRLRACGHTFRVQPMQMQKFTEQTIEATQCCWRKTKWHASTYINKQIYTQYHAYSH